MDNVNSDRLPLGPPVSLPPLNPRVLSNLLSASPYPAHSISYISATEAFNTGLAARDHMRCVVCGYSIKGCVVNCHIIPKNGIDSAETWDMLKEYNAIPQRAKSHQHESRNGLMMCMNHHQSFNDFHWFVRFMPRRREYVFVDLSNHPDIAHFHDKSLNLDPEDPRAPFPAAFLMHEARARGHRPFSDPKISDCLPDPNNGDGEGTYPGSSNEHPEGGGAGEDDHGASDEHENDHMTVTQADLQQSCSNNAIHMNPAPAAPSLSDMPARNDSSKHPKYRRVLTSLEPVDFNDPATIKFLSRDNMIELGFKNWIACEAENRDNVSLEHDTSVSVGRGGVGGRDICGMDPHDVHQWVMDVPSVGIHSNMEAQVDPGYMDTSMISLRRGKPPL